MSSIFAILGTGRGALLAQQQAVDVTGHNIANVNTPGYTRQRVVMQANEPISTTPGQVGSGVRTTEIQRIYDRFIDFQINSETQSLARWEGQNDTLGKVEILVNESQGMGLNQALSDFWAGWQDLANNPAGTVERGVLVANAEFLAQGFNNLHGDLVGIQTDIDSDVASAVTQINLLADQIDQLNAKISQTEISGLNANDFRDQRGELLKALSQLVDFSASEASDGTVSVVLPDGNTLVGNPPYGRLSTASRASARMLVLSRPPLLQRQHIAQFRPPALGRGRWHRTRS